MKRLEHRKTAGQGTHSRIGWIHIHARACRKLKFEAVGIEDRERGCDIMTENLNGH